jgi:predicted RNA-binding Zn-ribbon protein involved in translation (DUF1610 family)
MNQKINVNCLHVEEYCSSDLEKYEGEGDFEFYCQNPDCGHGINITEETRMGDGIYECQKCGVSIKVRYQ